MPAWAAAALAAVAPALTASVAAADVPGWVGKHATAQATQAEEQRQAANPNLNLDPNLDLVA